MHLTLINGKGQQAYWFVVVQQVWSFVSSDPALIYFPHCHIHNHNLNPSTPMSDQDRIFPYNINTTSTG